MLFTILVVINFVVVTKGATRVSEVTAEYHDAMPGKQMAIDADNAGLITQDEALERRERVAGIRFLWRDGWRL